MARNACPISRDEFREHAKSLELTIDGQTMRVPTKEFKTDSFGWYLNGKTTVRINGQEVPVQLGLSFTVIGSKECE